MKNIRIILISILTIMAGNIALSHFRTGLQKEYIAATEYGKVNVAVSPTGLMPELDKSEDCARQSSFYATFNLLGMTEVNHRRQQCRTGAVLKEIAVNHWGRYSDIKPSRKYKGIFEINSHRNLLGYWGPKGFSTSSVKELGIFNENLLINRGFRISPSKSICYDLYDKQTKTIYTLQIKRKNDGNLDGENATVSKIELTADTEFIGFIYDSVSGEEAISFEYFDNTWLDVGLTFRPAMKKATEQQIESESYKEYEHYVDNNDTYTIDMTGKSHKYLCRYLYRDMCFYDSKGQVYVVDDETEEIKPLCMLPVDIDTIEDEYYSCMFNAIKQQEYDQIVDTKNDKLLSTEIIGYYFASYSRNNELSVTLYDKEGKVTATRSGDSNSRFIKNMSKGLWVCRTIVESMPGPLIAVSSYFTRDMFGPMEQWQTVILMPLSLANCATMLKDGDPLEYLKYTMLSYILAGALAGFYIFNVKKYGLSSRERKYWLYLIILFGIFAFIAYMIYRPKVVQVTCGNCGKLRRPDQERCHSCRAGWDMPQLETVGWAIK